MNNIQLPLMLSLSVLLALLVSSVSPTDRLTWVMEVMPVFIAAPLLFITYKRFPLTPILYVLIAQHAIVLVVGGAYTYAHVPFGFWLQEFFDLERNPYDKIGHFMQGLVPTLVAREILLRRKYITRVAMAIFLSVCVAMAFSAFYELVEWWAALMMGQGAEEFLGTQGDPWDTQSDMFLAMIGGIIALLTVARIQDRQMRKEI